MHVPAWASSVAAAAILFLGVSPAPAAASSDGTPSIAAAYEDYQVLLDRHLREKDLPGDGLVSAFDYEGALERDDTDELIQNQRDTLSDFDVDTLETREQATAFWLNAYNFFIIAHILEERPNGELVDSVWDYGGRYNPLRKNVFQREIANVGGQTYSLDEIEKEILLGDEYWDKGWADARVHFAVNCASVGCPPLRADIYTPDNVDDLLTENTRRAFNTERQLRVEDDTLYVTELFDWYEEEFAREEGSIKGYIKAYADDEVVEAVEETKRIRHIDYDWKLNTREHFPELNGEH